MYFVTLKLYFPPTFSSNFFSKGLGALKMQVAVWSGVASQYDLYFAVSEVGGRSYNP